MNKMRLKFTLAIISMFVVLALITSVIASAEQIRPANQVNQDTGYSPNVGSDYSSTGTNENNRNDQIRPAAQTDNRGVGEQIRPANQLNQDTGYSSSEGSRYSSGQVSEKTKIDMKADLLRTTETAGNITSSASGTGSIIVNKRANTLSYDITYQDLSSNETEADIYKPFNGTDTVLFSLPLGQHKVGVLSYGQSLELDILNGMSYINIHSILFPNGELKGQIITI